MKSIGTKRPPVFYTGQSCLTKWVDLAYCDGMTPGLINGSRSVTSIIVNSDSAFAEPSIEMCNNVSSRFECSLT